MLLGGFVPYSFGFENALFFNYTVLTAILCAKIKCKYLFLNEILRLCCSAETEIVLNLFLNFKQK